MAGTVKVLGVRLAVEGAEKFDKELNEARASLKLNAAQLKSAQAQCKLSGNAITNLTAVQEELTKGINVEKDRRETLNQVLEETKKRYGENSIQAQNVMTDIAKSEAHEAELEAQLRETNKEIAEQSNKLKRAGTNIQNFGEKIKGYSENMSKWGKTLSVGVTTPLLAIGTAAGKMYLDYEKSAAKVATVMDTTAMSAGEMSDAIMAAATEVGYSATDYAEATYQAISASVDTADAVDFVKEATKLAEGGFTELTTAIDIETTALNAYGLEASEATRVSDVLIQTQNKGKTTVDQLASNMGKVIPTAAAYNVSIENLGTSLAILTAGGISTEQSCTYLKSMLNELAKTGSNVSETLKKQTGKTFSELMQDGYSVGDALAVLGVDVSGLKTKIKTLTDSGMEFDEALKKLTEEEFANATAFANLWSSQEAGTAALALLNAGTEQYNETLTDMEGAAGSTQSAFDTMQTKSVKLEKSTQKLKNELTAFGEELTPAVDMATGAISKLASWFGNLSDSGKKTVITITGIAAAAGPVITVGGKVVKLGGSIIKGTGKLVTWLGKLQKTTVASFGAVSVVLAGAAVLYEHNKKKLEEYTESVSRITTAMSDFQSGVDSATSVLSGFDNTMSSSQIAEIDDSIAEAENKILTISETAAAESRKITDAEAEEINRLIGMIDSYCAEKISAYTEQQDVVAAMINNETSMTSTAAQTYMASAADAYNQILDQAQQQRTEMYAQAKGDKTLQQEADQIYNDTINAAMEKYGDSLDVVAQKYYTQNIATDESISKVIELAKAAQEAQKAYDDYAASEDMSYDTLTTTYLNAVNETQDALEKALEGLSDDQAAAFGNYISMAAEAEIYTGEAQTQAADLVDAVAGAMEGVPEDTKKTFTNAMQGAINGLKEKEPELYKKASNIANGVISRFNVTFEVKSPSRVMRRLFGYVGQGGVLGLEDEESNFYKVADRIAGGVTDKFNAKARMKLAKAVSVDWLNPVSDKAKETLTELISTDWSKYANFGSIEAAQARAVEAARQYSYNSSYHYSNDDNRQYNTTEAGIHIGNLVVSGTDGQSLDSQLELIEEKRGAAARARGTR